MIPPASAIPVREPRVVRSVVHASALLKALQRTGTPTTLSDLARKVGLSKPATHTLLRTLELSGFVVRDDNARYQLGWGLYELGSSVARSTELTGVARMHLDRLAELTGEAVLLGILDNATVLYLDRDQAGEPFSMVANIGRRSPLHTNASGKVLLAHQSSRYIDGVAKSSLLADHIPDHHRPHGAQGGTAQDTRTRLRDLLAGTGNRARQHCRADLQPGSFGPCGARGRRPHQTARPARAARAPRGPQEDRGRYLPATQPVIPAPDD